MTGEPSLPMSSQATDHISALGTFWIPLGLVCLFTGLFLFVRYRDVSYIIKEVYETPELQTPLLLAQEVEDGASLETRARIALEQDVLMLRHTRLKAAIANRTWLRFTTIAFGAVLITVGAIFVLARRRPRPPSSECCGQVVPPGHSAGISASTPAAAEAAAESAEAPQLWSSVPCANSATWRTLPSVLPVRSATVQMIATIWRPPVGGPTVASPAIR